MRAGFITKRVRPRADLLMGGILVVLGLKLRDPWLRRVKRVPHVRYVDARFPFSALAV